MADVGEEDEYESDPEQAKLSLKMRRRREASDDEEEEDDGDDVRVRGRARVIDSRVSDCESDDQGAAAEYDDDEYDVVEEEEELLEEVDDGEYGDGRGRSEVQGVGEDLDGGKEGSSVGVKRETDQTDGDGFYAPESVDQFDDNGNGTVGDGEGEGEGGQEEKKENEPFQVPTAGAFYMHDDRFRDSSGGRHSRRTLGGRKLWETRDDRKWGHDKFEELSQQERHYDEGRRAPRGRNRAPRGGRNRGEDRNFASQNRPKTFNNNNNNNQTNAPRPVRGRGPRKYQPSSQNNFEASSQNRQPAKQMEKTGHANSGRPSGATSASESTQVPARKNVLASNLNSASPPFYPSGNKETNVNQKKDSQTGPPLNRRENYPISQQSRRNVPDSLNMEKLYIDDSGPSFINPTQRTDARGQSQGQGQGQGPFGQVAYQQVPPHHNEVNRVSSPNQVHSLQRPPALNQIHPNLQLPGQQFGQRSASGSRASSPPKESTEMESNDSKTALVGKGKGSIQAGMTSFPYHGDQNFPGAPTFLPVMQFAGQHPGGLGVPAVGMAFPGYVAQPNGTGNSEMTWLPVLAGAAGALGAAGATYCSPYITMDGAYHARPSGQTSALPPTSKDGSTNKVGGEVKPSQRPELANDELRQRQTKARRYTEMKFDK